MNDEERKKLLRSAMLACRSPMYTMHIETREQLLAGLEHANISAADLVRFAIDTHRKNS